MQAHTLRFGSKSEFTPWLGSLALHGALALLATRSGVDHLRNPGNPRNPHGTMLVQLLANRAERVIPVTQPSRTAGDTRPKFPNSRQPVESIGSILPPAKVQAPIQGTEEATALESYVIGFRALVEKRKNYPLLSRRMGEAGRVRLRLRILRDGTVQEVTLQEGSAFKRLDQSALEAVETIKKYRPFPESVAKNDLLIDLPIEFTL
jgi:TonB family protein